MLEWRGMDTKTNRRLQLVRIIKTMFDEKSGQCADALKIKRPQLSRWITENENARQGISEEAARSIEEKLGLPRGSLDEDLEPKTEAQQPDPVIADFAWTYNNVNDDGKDMLRKMIHAAKAGYTQVKKSKSA